MKKLSVIAVGIALMAFSSATYAQKQQDTSSIGYDIKKGARKVGDKTSETASKGVAVLRDKIYQDKVGPQGETIYIDKHSSYYYINNKGRKVYVTKTQMKDKPQD